MFTLRKITKTGVEMNFDLGNHYKERSPEEGEILYLYKDHKNYIVSENGTTYSNLTYK